MLDSPSKVMSGSAPLGQTSVPVDNRFATFACATIGATPLYAEFAPVWSEWQCVLTTNLSGLSVSRRKTARLSSADWASTPSTRSTPSSPIESAACVNVPFVTNTLPETRSSVTSGFAPPVWAAAAVAKSRDAAGGGDSFFVLLDSYLPKQ